MQVGKGGGAGWRGGEKERGERGGQKDGATTD